MIHSELYIEQRGRWPSAGRHILAHFDAATIIVYQAFSDQIGKEAALKGKFGEGFSLSRMSWIKPNFLWMMYRCGWGTKQNQETVLAIRIPRVKFQSILALAVPSTFDANRYSNIAEWRAALASSSVRLQWDPDRTPTGTPLLRRAIQLGLRGEVLAAYAHEWIVEIEDITSFVRTQHQNLLTNGKSSLLMPREEVYPLDDEQAANAIGVTRLVLP